jgi:predicted ATPase
LAQEYLRAHHPNGAFVELVDARDADDVVARLARDLGISLTSSDPRRQLTTGIAARGDSVVVLDNAEHVPGAVGDLVAHLAGETDARFIVTSRVRTSADGEQIVDLGALDAEDAAALFRERARAVRADFSADDHVVDAIVRGLDGLPLAIELAAARMRVLTAQQMSERLDVLAAGMSGALDTSWELLELDLRSALTQCTVFRGGFSLEAAEAVVAITTGRPVLDAVQSLCEQSLVEAFQSGRAPDRLRYRLYESVRAYASARLIGQDADAARDRHAAHFAAMHDGSGIVVDTDNLVAAHRHALDRNPSLALDIAVALDGILKHRGPMVLRGAILDKAITACETATDVEPRRRIDALLGRSHAHSELGRLDAARTDLDRALGLARDVDDTSREGRAIASIGRLAWHAGDVPAAAEAYQRALPLLEQCGDHEQVALTRLTVANVHTIHGDAEAARDEYERALDILRALDSRPDLLGLVLGNLANLELNVDELEAAERHVAEAVDVLRECGERYFEGTFLLNRAQIAFARGRRDEARALGDDALALQREVGNRRWQGVTHVLFGEIDEARGDIGAARDSFERGVSLIREFGHPLLQGVALCKLARLEANAGRVAVAERRLNLAREHLTGDDPLAALVHVCGGELALAAGDAEAANELAGRAVDAASQSSEVRWALARLRANLAEANAATARTVAIGAEGRWFELPGGDRVDLSKRRALRLILAALATADRALDLDELLAAGWPGENVVPEAGQARVYTAVATLRRMGLRELLLRRDDGYLLDPSIAIDLRPDA